MRDYTKLKAFQLADALVLSLYEASGAMPKHELFGLTAQMRRAAVSIPSNIVEGCGREGQGEYVHFLSVAFASARELEYQLSLASRLGYVSSFQYEQLHQSCTETSKTLGGLIRSLRRSPAQKVRMASAGQR